MSSLITWSRRGLGLLVLLLAGPLFASLAGLADRPADWRSLQGKTTHLAPKPGTTSQAVLQVYGARTFGWRGAFAEHTWIAAKRAGAGRYRTYQVVGWRHPASRDRVVVLEEVPDQPWAGARPRLYLDLRGNEVEGLIDKVEAAVAAYPYKADYRAWPGPNSNTFTAWVARSVPELRLDLPPTAVGKDYLGPRQVAARAPSGTGYQLSLFGLLGVTAGIEEGLELNLLGLGLGLDPLDLALRLPGVGRVP